MTEQRTARDATDVELLDIVRQVRAIQATGRRLDPTDALVAAACITEAYNRGLPTEGA